MLNFKSLQASFREFFKLALHFGIRVAFYAQCARLFHCCKQRKHKAILQYLRKHYVGLLNEYRTKAVAQEILHSDSPIWVCWFQGEEQMPPLVKKCLATVRENCETHPVRIITLRNLKNYLLLPDFILEKVEKRAISLTHFSDIVRNNLLVQYGGIWLDATIYLTAPLQGWNLPFYTIRQDRPDDFNYVSAYRWTSFCIGGVKIIY